MFGPRRVDDFSGFSATTVGGTHSEINGELVPQLCKTYVQGAVHIPGTEQGHKVHHGPEPDWKLQNLLFGEIEKIVRAAFNCKIHCRYKDRNYMRQVDILIHWYIYD